MKIINMLSSADKVKGQGVGSAYLEQVALVKELHDYNIEINSKSDGHINHYHTIDLKHYLRATFSKKPVHLGYVHFLPETISGSIKLPKPIRKIFDAYIVSFYKKMDYLVTVNPYFIDLLEAHGVDRNKVDYIPNFVSEEKFYAKSKEEIIKLKEAYGIYPEDFVVLGVGQVQTRKGVVDFIDIAKRNSDKTFIWAGGFSFGAITDGYSELKEMVENPPENVKFLGIIDRKDMNDIYNMSDLLFMPSYSELFPMAILESMSVGKPILLRDLDIYEVILEGYYLKGDCINSFSAIINQLSFDKKYYKEAVDMSRAGSIFYSRQHVLNSWKKLYNRLSKEETYEKKSVLVDY
ncbi:glycosyltransferase family 4 protein [Acidaminobacter sp. JC074]|uniref:glycosyltransferase family 4 protein n=1 Tax=Acidaminobacter sp. JC074 TaxID=2530199 RepID=UPI001F0D5BA7|nr:glycosyltransferase family 4 protein [Acidaminobacter sp. JC074]MCH4890895.1 glycosyltransferase family 4 protein [Acidaminobacter sp. JC074]